MDLHPRQRGRVEILLIIGLNNVTVSGIGSGILKHLSLRRHNLSRYCACNDIKVVMTYHQGYIITSFSMLALLTLVDQNITVNNKF